MVFRTSADVHRIPMNALKYIFTAFLSWPVSLLLCMPNTIGVKMFSALDLVFFFCVIPRWS